MPPGESKAKFIEPMLLLPAETLPDWGGSTYELKLDGYRAIGVKTTGKSIMPAETRSKVTGNFNIDAEVHKQFRMPYKEGHLLTFRLEAFNALNHPNWGMPNLNILAGAAYPGQPRTNAHQNFGLVGSTSVGMRQIQLGLKCTF